jgi:hypothetical protein
MSDLNWNKSSFSADSANCVEVAWCTSSFCHQGSCVEVGWTASSRCAGGDCVEVTRTSGLTEMVLVARSQQGQVQAPIQSWTVDEWRDLLRQIKWGWEQPEGVFLLADGRVEFSLDRHEKLTYDAGEWEAFIKDVPNDRFEPENLADYGTWARESSKLSEGVSAGSGSVAGSGEAATGTDVSWRGAVPVAAEQQFGATNDGAITWIEDPSLGDPQGPSAGRPVDVSTDEVDLSFAVQPGSEDAAGTGVPPDPVPVAQLPEGCDECESTGYNCPLHDGPEWLDEQPDPVPVARIWVLAEEPGPEVTHVVDADGDKWTHRYSATGALDWWLAEESMRLSWSQLLVEYGPLTDATPAVAPLVRTDGVQ